MFRPRATSVAALALGLLALSSTGCNAVFGIEPGETSEDVGSGGSGSGGSGSGGSGSGGSGAGGSGAGGSSGDGCSEAAKLVYVLSKGNVLYSFRPDQKQFTEIGLLDCQTTMAANSMAVDRNAVAWVNFVEKNSTGVDTAGMLFKVSTKDASCQPTYSIESGSAWYRIGMGFSSHAVGEPSEALYVAATGASAGTNPGLAKIDTAAGTFAIIGSFSDPLSGRSAELTGTGDARLYGFFGTTPVQIAEIDKDTAALKSVNALPEVQTPSSWAVSFWGGDLYLYTAPADKTVDSTVSRYSPATGSIDPAYMTNIGFRVVGAGVSTCAPLKPPI
jgi:hypothetical protein